MSIFATACGWFGLVGDEGSVLEVKVGYDSAEAVRRAVTEDGHRTAGEDRKIVLVECDWHPRLRQRLAQYCSGVPTDFDDIPVTLPAGTPFQRRVLELTARIGYGSTTTYGELASRAGSPRAARAVGSVMASNRLPILIPCHRVVASGGKLGGYSSPQGTDLKLRLLALEREGRAARPALRMSRRRGGLRQPAVALAR